MTLEDVQQRVAAVRFWWHSIDLGHGVVSAGFKGRDQLAAELARLRLPDLAGRDVLDIGAWDGFFSFAAERLGARRVLALDHYVWHMDLERHVAYWRECRERQIEPADYESRDYYHPDALPGKAGFDTARELLASRVESRVDDFMTMDLAALGRFDVVLYLGVLYHMKDPFAALRRLFSVTRELAVIETVGIEVPGYAGAKLAEFYEGGELNHDVSNWWGFTAAALLGMCRAAGFRRAVLVAGVEAGRRSDLFRAARGVLAALRPGGGGEPLRYRAVVHAFR